MVVGKAHSIRIMLYWRVVILKQVKKCSHDGTFMAGIRVGYCILGGIAGVLDHRDSFLQIDTGSRSCSRRVTGQL